MEDIDVNEKIVDRIVMRVIFDETMLQGSGQTA